MEEEDLALIVVETSAQLNNEIKVAMEVLAAAMAVAGGSNYYQKKAQQERRTSEKETTGCKRFVNSAKNSIGWA